LCSVQGSGYENHEKHSTNSLKVKDTGNVLLANVAKKGNFLGFEFVGTGSEREHLKSQSDRDKNALVDKAKEMSESGMSIREIAEQLGVSKSTVANYLKDETSSIHETVQSVQAVPSKTVGQTLRE